MNKLKNNVIRSIPNLHQEMKVEYGKILSAIKPNELQEPKTAKYMQLDLKNKINSSIRENVTSLSSERQQPKKIKKIDGKVATIVELIKQDLLPMLNIQNDRIEKLERRFKVKNESDGDCDLRKSSIISDKKSNSVVECEVQNLSVSVDEIKKNLSHLDNFVKYQFIKCKCQPSEALDNKNKSLISQIQSKINTEMIQQKIDHEQTTKQLQDYITLQLQEIKDWINNIQQDQQKELEIKLNLMETQFYSFLYQPLEVLRQIQTNQKEIQIKIQQFDININSQAFQNSNQDNKHDVICCKQDQTNMEIIKINCGHSYHQQCLEKLIEIHLNEKSRICCQECHSQIRSNAIRQAKVSKQILDQFFKQQIQQLISSSKLDFISCATCGFISVRDQNGENQQSNCVQCT